MIERTPGMYPIAEPPPDSLFVYDFGEAAAQLGLSPRKVIELASSGELLFKYVPSAGKGKCPKEDIEVYKRKLERRQQQGR